MLLCPTCGDAYREPRLVCPRDDSPLKPAAEVDWRIGTQVGNYRLLDLLGRGGMGMVYRAEHVYIGKQSAIKILHEASASIPDAVERLLQEARAAAIIGHPNIIDVSDFGETPDGLTYFVMELVEGRAVDDVLEKDGPIPLLRSINIVNQIGRGLGAAHEKGIVHRDLKPANVMLQQRPGRREIVRRLEALDDNGRERYAVEKESTYDFVKILDFGGAKMLHVDPTQHDLVDAVIGTPHYMAPETVRRVAVDRRIDIYALGVVFFEMLTGSVPFDAGTTIEVLRAQCTQPIPRLRERNPHVHVTDAAEQLIFHALAKDPDERPQTMEEFLTELQGCFGDETFLRDVEHRMPAAVSAGIRPKARRITEELTDLFAPAESSGSDILERAFADDAPSAATALTDDEGELT